MAHVTQQRERHRQQDALLDADNHYNRRGGQCQSQLPRALAADVAQPAHVDETDGDREYDRSKYTARQILQRSGEEKKYERNDPRGSQVRELASAAGALNHRGLRRAAVHYECAAERRGRIGR